MPGAMRPCDLIVYAGTLLADAEAAVLEDAALAIAGGRIAALGPRGEIDRHWRAPQVLDGGSGIALPGLVNVHNHTPLVIVRGIVEDLGWAPAYTPSIPQGYRLTADDAYALSCLGAWELLRSGSTTIADHYVHADRLMQAADLVGLRAFTGGWIIDVDMPKVAEGRWEHRDAIGDKTLERALDFNARWRGRSPRLTPVLVPHAPDTCSRGLLERVAEVARESGLQVHIHLAQSPLEVKRIREREGLSPPALLAETGLLDRHTVAAHCIHLAEDDVALLGGKAARVAHSPLGNASAGWIAPVQRLEAAGARIGLCTDAKSNDMLEAMRMAIAAGRILGGGLELSAARVFGWATTGGAEILGLKEEVGSLRVGMKADLILLDGEAVNLRPLLRPLGSVVHNGIGANVRHSVIEGEIVMRDFKPTRFDATALIEEVEGLARTLWRDCGFAVPMGATVETPFEV